MQEMYGLFEESTSIYVEKLAQTGVSLPFNPKKGRIRVGVFDIRKIIPHLIKQRLKYEVKPSIAFETTIFRQSEEYSMGLPYGSDEIVTMTRPLPYSFIVMQPWECIDNLGIPIVHIQGAKPNPGTAANIIWLKKELEKAIIYFPFGEYPKDVKATLIKGPEKKVKKKNGELRSLYDERAKLSKKMILHLRNLP